MSISSCNSDDDLVNYIPIFDGNSKILENIEEIKVLCSHIPIKFLAHQLKMKFSIQRTGFSSQKFVDSYLEITGPSLLLIETYKKKVLGLFLDRKLNGFESLNFSDSCIFVLRPEPKVFNHQQGQIITICLDLKNGFIIKDSEK